MQVKYDLTKSVAGEEDKEAVHCEFDVTDSAIDWLSGQICVDVILVDRKKLCKKIHSPLFALRVP